MLELKEDGLVFSFTEVHPSVKLRIDFKRTLRIPDDNQDYPLPPDLGKFPVRHVDDYKDNVPEDWNRHGGVMLPMYQSEALWVNFDCQRDDEREVEYPFAIKIAAGKVNAVTGKPWSNELATNPQDYLIAPKQPWMDGYCIKKGIVRQFVAMPLGSGYTAEEQIDGGAEHGGIQIIVYPMKRDDFISRFPKPVNRIWFMEKRSECPYLEMGLAAGGRIKQEIYEDQYGITAWENVHRSRCFVHLANSLIWRQITSKNPPDTPCTANEYEKAGLPWFEYYAGDAKVLGGSNILDKVKSISQVAEMKSDNPLPENKSVTPRNVINLSKDTVRDGENW